MKRRNWIDNRRDEIFKLAANHFNPSDENEFILWLDWCNRAAANRMASLEIETMLNDWE